MYNVLYLCHDPHLIGGSLLSAKNLIHAVSANGEVKATVLIAECGVASRYLEEQGIEVFVCRFENNVRHPRLWVHCLHFLPKLLRNAIVNRRCLSRLHEHFGATGFDIVHTNTSLITFGMQVARSFGARHVWHLREFQDIDFNLTPFLGWRHLRRQIAESDAAIAISQAIFEHWRLDSHKNAVCLWDAVCRKDDVRLVLPKRPYFLLCAALLNHAKGVDTAIRAFAQSELASQGYKLRLTGRIEGDADRKFIDDLIAANGLQDSVELPGFCSDIRETVSQATAFLMCSQNEGLGRVTVEAMFYGCPVIARRSGGTLDFIRDGETGLLFDTDEACARLMQAMAERSPLEMVQRAQQFAIGHFSEEGYGLRILQLYRTLHSGEFTKPSV